MFRHVILFFWYTALLWEICLPNLTKFYHFKYVNLASGTLEDLRFRQSTNLNYSQLTTQNHEFQNRAESITVKLRFMVLPIQIYILQNHEAPK